MRSFMNLCGARLSAAVCAIALSACAGAVPAELGVQADSGELVACPDSPNCVSSRAGDASHAIQPFQIAGDVAAGWLSVRESVASLAGVRVVTQTDRYLHAESTSLLMRYVDDLELVLDPATGRIDVRSASRVGDGDMGVNFARVQTLRTLLTRRGVLAE